MEAPKKYRITKWLNIFLLVINISAIGTILLMSHTSEKQVSDQFSSDEFLRARLRLSEEQYRKISELDAQIFRVYQSIIDKQCEEQFKLLNELSMDDPSREYMDSLAVNIGRLHTGMKRQTIKHFMNIKSIVDEDQAILLEQILIEMMEMNEQCQFCNKTDCDRRDHLLNERK